MSCGLPVLTTPFDGVNELITNGKDGFILNGFDKNEIADTINRIIYDDMLLGRVSKNALTSTERFDIDQMVKSYVQLIDKEV